MNSSLNKFILPSWISSRVYKLQDKDGHYFKAYISNERTHEYLSFQGSAAKLWSFILNEDYNGLVAYAKENDFSDELDLYFEELKKWGLLVNDQENILNSFNYKDTMNKNSDKEEIIFLEKMEEEIRTNGYLASLFMELTYKCNLKCFHCYNEKENVHQEISFNDIKNAIEEAAELGVFGITLSGGECTLDKNFLEIAAYIRKKKISLSIFTNGQKFYDEPDFLEKFLALYPSKIFLSLYSMDAATHDKVTGLVGSYKKTIAIIKYLRERNVEVGIKCFLTKHNYKDYKAIEKFAEDIKASVTFDMTLLLNKDKSNTNVGLSPEEIKTLYTNADSPFIEVIEKSVKKEGQDLDEIICRGGHYFVCIAPDLTVYPCASVKVKFGNLKKDSLSSIWKCNDENSSIRKFKNLRRRDKVECYKEEYCGHCSYCMGMAEVENGFLKKSDVCCTHAKIKYKLRKERNNEKNKI